MVHCPIAKSEGNVQEVAREARRAAALDVAEQSGCDRIALGHTADDQVETLLYRMGRYGGLAALAGMRPCDPPWVRPLLECRREETAAYCVEQRSGVRLRSRQCLSGVRAHRHQGERAARLGGGPARGGRRRLSHCRGGGRDEGVGGGGVGASRCYRSVSPAAMAGLSAAALLSLPAPVRRLLLHDWLSGRATPAASRASVLAVESLLSVPGSAQRALGGGWRASKEYDLIQLERGDMTLPAVPGAGVAAGARRGGVGGCHGGG